MITFPDLNQEYVTVSDCIVGKFGLKCPECKNHNDPDLYNEPRISGDCKTLIYENKLNAEGKLVLRCQCMCYSKEHWREE